MARTNSRRGRKAVAIAAVAGVLGAGVYSTLASWNDNEWVVAGVDGDGNPDLGTSTFEVEQNRDQSPAAGAAFENLETNATAGDLEFTTAVSLSPGTTIYAPVALRTATDSLAGEVTLQAPVPSAAFTADDTADLLWGAMTYSVRTTDEATQCDSTTWSTFGAEVATSQAMTSPLSAPTQELDANAGSVQYYCFALTLPTSPTLPGGATIDDLQGRTIYPAWNFASTSVG